MVYGTLNSPRATVCMHLAPTASKRVYQQRIGRIMRTHPRKEAGIVVDFVAKPATHNERAVSLHSLLDADFYREGAPPTVGFADAVPVLERRVGATTWTTLGHGLANSFDLAYTYGLVEAKAKGAAHPDTSSFVHVWRKDVTGKWKLALDIENEFPKRK